MKTKLILSFALVSLMLCSCQSNTKKIPQQAIVDDLFSMQLSSFDSNYPFIVEYSSPTNSKDGESFFYTFTFKYKNTQMNNFKLVMIPSYAEEHKYEAYTDLGYRSNVNLTETTSKDNNSYSGFNVSYKSNKDNATFYFNVTSDFSNNASYNFKIEF